jgi:hypothetical protein
MNTQTLTSFEPITPKESKLIFVGDNYYEWSEETKTTLEGKNLLKCIENNTYEDYAKSKKENADKAKLKKEYETEVRCANRKFSFVPIKILEGESEDEITQRKEKDDVKKRETEENLEDEMMRINRDWRSIRLRWIEEEERSVKDWEEANQKCRSILKKSVDPARKILIKKLTTAQEMWEALKKEGAGTKLAQVMGLKRSLYKTEQGGEESLMSFLERIELMCAKINALGEEEMNEREKCFLIVASLHNRYDSISQSICLSSTDQFNLARVREIFSLENEREKKDHNIVPVNLSGERKNSTTDKNNTVKTNNSNNNNNECKQPGCNNATVGSYRNCTECYVKWQNKMKENKKSGATNCNTEIKSNNWYLDSACTRHITNDVKDLSESWNSNTEISGPTDERSSAVLEGTTILRYNEKEVYLKDVLFVPLVKRKLISVGLLVKQGCRSIFAHNKCEISFRGEIIMTGILDKEELFRITAIKNSYKPVIACKIEKQSDKIREWHERLGHASRSQLKSLIE